MPVVIAIVAAVLGAIGVVAPSYLRGLRRELARPYRMREVADELGFVFSEGDPAFPSSSAFQFPFELFSRGVDHRIENVMTGALGGAPIVAFDFLYRARIDTDGEPGNDALSEPIRFSCAVTTAPGWRPHLVIEPARTPLHERADGEPVALEWGTFNERFRVVSRDRGFAPAVLDLPLMAWLVDQAPRLALTWETQREHVLCRAQGIAPEEMPHLVRAAAEMARRISRAASD